jgi:hypothetical protein
MSISLIIERRGEGVERISIDDWRQFVSDHNGVRFRTEPYVALNPLTSQQISLPLGEADSEVLVKGEWLPFLRYKTGKLVTEYQEEFEYPSNEIRIEIARAAAVLHAVIGTDLGDEVFDWKLP